MSKKNTDIKNKIRDMSSSLTPTISYATDIVNKSESKFTNTSKLPMIFFLLIITIGICIGYIINEAVIDFIMKHIFGYNEEEPFSNLQKRKLIKNNISIIIILILALSILYCKTK